MAKKKEDIFILNNPGQLAKAMRAIAMLKPTVDQPYIIRVAPEQEKRRSKQNRLSFLWYNERGEQSGYGTKHERRHCKLHHGIPIMRQHEDFNEYWEATIGCFIYEQQLMAIEHLDVTSLMSVTEFAHYLTEVDNESSELGHVLTHPEDLYWAALMKEGEQR